MALNNKIFYLGANFEKDKPFFLLKSKLYHKKKIVFSPPKGSRLCAGSFYKNKKWYLKRSILEKIFKK